MFELVKVAAALVIFFRAQASAATLTIQFISPLTKRAHLLLYVAVHFVR